MPECEIVTVFLSYMPVYKIVVDIPAWDCNGAALGHGALWDCDIPFGYGVTWEFDHVRFVSQIKCVAV